MRETPLEKLRKAKRQQFKEERITSFDDLVALMVDGNRPREERQVNPTQIALIRDNVHSLKAYKGSAGCAKTSTGVAEVLLHALLEPVSKLFIARRDYNDLKGTTMQRAWEMVQRLPQGTLLDRNKEPPEKWWLRSIPKRLPDNTMLDTPSEITFIGMSDELKGSYEFNGGFVDEADECSEKAILGFLARCRWMGHPLSPLHRWMTVAFNPPPIEHWLYTACTGLNAQGEVVDKTPKMHLYNPQAKENARNLPPTYYEELALRLPEDMRQRLVDNEWGSTFPGEPVVRPFKRSIHTRPSIQYQGGTLFCFWDFGFTRPYFCGFQMHKSGRLQGLIEHLGHMVEVRPFVDQVRERLYAKFGTLPNAIHYGDPAVKQHKDTGSALSILREAGIVMRFQHTPFDVSMRILRKKFEDMIEGEPAILLDSGAMPILCSALGGGYHFKDDGVTPFKDGYYDHPVDALRYGVFNLVGLGAESNSTLPTNIAYWNSQGGVRQ